jgi:hypothetical protein
LYKHVGFRICTCYKLVTNVSWKCLLNLQTHNIICNPFHFLYERLLLQMNLILTAQIYLLI